MFNFVLASLDNEGEKIQRMAGMKVSV